MNKGFVLAIGATLLVACNTKSPETQEPTEAQPDVVVQDDVATPDDAPPSEPAVVRPAATGPLVTALDLLVNRPNAHRVETTGATTLVVDASAPDFVRYVHGNHAGDWKIGVEMDGKPGVLLNKKRTGKMWVPAFASQGQVQLEVWSGSESNALKLNINGQATDAQKLQKGWQVLTFDGVALRAENTIEFDFSNMARVDGALTGGGVAWMRLGAAGENAPTNDVPTSEGAWTLTSTHGATYLVWGVPGAQLRIDAQGSSECAVSVSLETEDGKGGTQSVGKHDVRTATSVDLKALAGQIGRVTLSTSGTCEVPLRSAVVGVPGETPTVPKVEPPKYVVFWLIDTLRADHLPIHFDTNVRAPNLKALAEQGASFKLAYVQGNESKTSHASLFSAMMPSKHRVIGKGKLAPELLLMPEAMKAAGYKTAGFVANGYVSGPWGFEQGWDAYRNHIRDEIGIDGMTMAKTGLEWATKNVDKPFFLYIGTSDPHVTYREHEEFIGNYETTPYNGKFKRACYGEDLALIKQGKLEVSARDKERIQNLYKNEIEFNDHALGELRKGFEALGIWDQTMVVVTADHGDEFWEHGGVGHGHSLYQDQTHVPLIFYYPPLIKAGTTVEAGVDVLDVYPTLVDVVGKERPSGLQGKSVLPLIYKVTADYPEPAVATQYLLHYGAQMQQWKVYLRRGEYQIYDRINDPFEKSDVAGQHPLASRWLLDAVGWKRAYRNSWDKAELGATSNLKPGAAERIKALKRD